MGADSIWWRATFSVAAAAKSKLRRLKDRNYLALVCLEFMLMAIILAALLIYIDPDTNTLQPPFNFLLFGGIVLIVMYVYRYTESFREYNVSKRKTSLRIFSYELLISGIVVAAAIVYKDPTLNTLPYPFNFLLFLGILSIPLYFYVNEKFVVG